MMTLDELRKRPHVSVSAINQFLNCSLQFAFDRVYQLEREFTPSSLLFGSVFHQAAEYVHWKKKDNVEVSETDAVDLFRDLWSRTINGTDDIRFKAGESADGLSELGAKMVSCLVANQDPEEAIVGVNVTFAINLPGLRDKPLIGEMDCVARRGDKRIVVDIKSAARKWADGKADRELQPAAYLMAHKAMTGEDATFRFDVVTKTKAPAYVAVYTLRTDDQIARFIHTANMVADMVKAEHWLPAEGSFFCASCPHQDACKAWGISQQRTISLAA